MLLERFRQALRKQDWFTVGLEVLIVFVGVVMAFGVDNIREARNEASLEQQYLDGFRVDLHLDLEMIEFNIASRTEQLEQAREVLTFFEGRPIDVNQFFGSYYPAIFNRSVKPNRNTMDEVLNSGHLRLLKDDSTRLSLLNLYAAYAEIEEQEHHMRRDMEVLLYDETFTSIPVRLPGPWEDDEVTQREVQALLNNLSVENGFRLIVINLEMENALFDRLESAKEKIQGVLELMD